MRKIRFDIRQAARPILTVFLALIAAHAVFYAAIVRPAVRDDDLLSESTRPLQQQLKRREAEVQAREGTLAGLRKAEDDLRHLREDILSTKRQRMIQVQLELDRLARQFNINLDRVRYENSLLEDEGLERMGMTVPLEGGYANLRKFLRAVESSDKFLVVEQVALASGKEGGVLLQLSITLATYFDSPELRESAPAARGKKA